MSTSFVNPGTVAHNISLSIKFSRQEYGSEFQFPSPGDLPNTRDQTRISYIGGQTSYHWATTEALLKIRASQQESCVLYPCDTHRSPDFHTVAKLQFLWTWKQCATKMACWFNFKIDTWYCSLKKRAPSTHIAMFGVFKASLPINSKRIHFP